MTLQECLAAAEAAYHQLMTGGLPVSFTDQNGERVEYNRASAANLAAYIANLRAQVAGQSRPHTIRVATSKGIN